MVSNWNAAASLGKVNPSPLLQHFSTLSPRIYCSVAYWQSCGGGPGIRKQATFLNIGKPKKMRDQIFFTLLYLTVCMHVVKGRQAVKGLVCSRRGTKYRSGAVCKRSQTKESLPTLNERWGAGVETQKNVRGDIGGWGRVPFNETYAPSLSTIYDGA